MSFTPIALRANPAGIICCARLGAIFANNGRETLCESYVFVNHVRAGTIKPQRPELFLKVAFAFGSCRSLVNPERLLPCCGYSFNCQFAERSANVEN
jgi:hypothetical protein